MSDTSKTHPTSALQAEGRFNILPYPAKPGKPADLAGAGNPSILAHHAREPHIPNQELLSKLEAPLSREELRRRAEELNK